MCVRCPGRLGRAAGRSAVCPRWRARGLSPQHRPERTRRHRGRAQRLGDPAVHGLQTVQRRPKASFHSRSPGGPAARIAGDGGVFVGPSFRKTSAAAGVRWPFAASAHRSYRTRGAFRSHQALVLAAANPSLVKVFMVAGGQPANRWSRLVGCQGQGCEWRSTKLYAYQVTADGVHRRPWVTSVRQVFYVSAHPSEASFEVLRQAVMDRGRDDSARTERHEIDVLAEP